MKKLYIRPFRLRATHFHTIGKIKHSKLCQGTALFPLSSPDFFTPLTEPFTLLTTSNKRRSPKELKKCRMAMRLRRFHPLEPQIKANWRLRSGLIVGEPSIVEHSDGRYQSQTPEVPLGYLPPTSPGQTPRWRW